MNIILDSLIIDVKKIGFLDTKKNIIIEGNFTKIIYSEPFITINGIYLQFPVVINSVFSSSNSNTHLNQLEKNNYRNYVSFLPSANQHLINLIRELENKIVDYFRQEFRCNKKTLNALYNQLMSGKIKLYKEGGGGGNGGSGGVGGGGTGGGENHPTNVSCGPSSPLKIVLKISGVWETACEIGITYKFLEMCDM
jgi:hypothetical protein